MIHSRTIGWLAGLARITALLLVIAGVSACGGGTRESTSHSASGERVTVLGTVVDAATGEPVSGIKVIGPHGTQCVSGSGGRFELEGLHVGDAGELAASASDGRAATVPLRPLHPGDLEVVLRLARR
jgi:hypothetical protein